jgi:hypothetical protein
MLQMLHPSGTPTGGLEIGFNGFTSVLYPVENFGVKVPINSLLFYGFQEGIQIFAAAIFS